MQISLYPFAVGLAYFIPLDLAFSCWASYLVIRAYFVAGRIYGWERSVAGQHGWPFLSDISLGAWMGLAGAILWASRGYLARAFAMAFARGGAGRTLRAVDPVEARRYRWAFLGLGTGVLFLVAWGSFLGISPPVTLGFFGILFAISLAITRIRAEFGVPHQHAYGRPIDVLINLFGTRALGPANMIGMQTMYWFTRGYRCHPMPNFLEGFKMGEGRDMPVARLVGMFVIASVVSLVATFAANYFLTYGAGATAKAAGYSTGNALTGWGSLAIYLHTGQEIGAVQFWASAGGLAVVALFAGLRSAFVGWPLHPAGFALAVSLAMNHFWFCVFVAWLVKLLVIRYGGMHMHRRLIPLFLGLILGDYTIGALWSLHGLVLGIPVYRTYP
jgi:hypothetical protein